MAEEREKDDPQRPTGPSWAPFGPSAGFDPDPDEERREQQPPPGPPPPAPPPSFQPPSLAPPPSFQPPSSAPPPVSGPPQPSGSPPAYGQPPPPPQGWGSAPPLPGYGSAPGYGAQQGYGAQPGYGAPPYPAYSQPYVARKTNPFAIASLILGALWLYWVGSILAVVFGHIGKSQIEKSEGTQDGRGLAIAGLVLGWIGVAVLILGIVALAAGA